MSEVRSVDDDAAPDDARHEPPSGDERPHGRAGRDLVAAVSVGVLLSGVIVASLLFLKVFFVAVVVAAVGLAVYELGVALRTIGVRVPTIPLVLGSVAMLLGAYVWGSDTLLGALGLTGFAVCVWRLFGGRDGFVRDASASVFVVLYVPLLASFALLLLREADGPFRVLTFMLVTIASDVGGYTAGVLAGRHPMAPTVSPKKSWEGLAGSALLCLATGVFAVEVWLDGPWWAGAIIGVVAAVNATMGDLFESMLKRDLGMKDMGSFLPGHGGIMDRLDSLLPNALVCWLLLSLLVPVAA